MHSGPQATNGPAGNEDHDGAAIVSSLTVDVATSRKTPCQRQRFSLAEDFRQPARRSLPILEAIQGDGYSARHLRRLGRSGMGNIHQGLALIIDEDPDA